MKPGTVQRPDTRSYTDTELIAALRKRSQWQRCGSMRMLRLLTVAADRIERLTNDDDVRRRVDARGQPVTLPPVRATASTNGKGSAQ